MSMHMHACFLNRVHQEEVLPQLVHPGRITSEYLLHMVDARMVRAFWQAGLPICAGGRTLDSDAEMAT